MVIFGIRPSFPGLSQSQGQITHVLLTRSPLEYPASWAFPFDLHVLSTPPAFVLSQDQTLHQKPFKSEESQNNERPKNLTKTKQTTTTHQKQCAAWPLSKNKTFPLPNRRGQKKKEHKP